MTEENNNKDENIVPADNNSSNNGGSSTNLDENIAALLCYLATFVTGIIFLIIEKKNQTIRFHAMQSVLFFAGIWIVGIVVRYVPFLGGMISMLLSLLGFIMWIVFMLKAYQKEYFKFPIVGQIAEDLVNKQK